MSASSLIQYNRARQSNIESLNIPIGTTPVLLLEMGIFNSVTTVNFLEIVSSIGYRTDAGIQITFDVIVDGTFVGTAGEQLFFPTVQDTQTTFQTILDNVTQGHHVIQLTAVAGEEGFVIVNGPLTMSASVYA